jgi:hypothetical protein
VRFAHTTRARGQSPHAATKRKAISGTKRSASASDPTQMLLSGASVTAPRVAARRKANVTLCQKGARAFALLSGWRDAKPSIAARAKIGAKWRQIASLTAWGDASAKAWGESRASIARSAFGRRRSGARTKLRARVRSLSSQDTGADLYWPSAPPERREGLP